MKSDRVGLPTLSFLFQDHFGNLGSLGIPYKFCDHFFHFGKKVIGILIEITVHLYIVNLYFSLGSIAILMTSSLLNHEHRVSFIYFDL